jgi:hypothetical protein
MINTPITMLANSVVKNRLSIPTGPCTPQMTNSVRTGKFRAATGASLPHVKGG